VSAPPDDGLFERLFLSGRADTLGPGHGLELYERRGAGLELSEDDDGLRITESRERGFALRLFKAGRCAFAASGATGALDLLEQARQMLPRARSRRGVRAPSLSTGESAEPHPLRDPPPSDEDAATELLTSFRRTLTAAGGGAVQIREASVSVGERRDRLASSGGRDAGWESRAATLVATVVGRSTAGRYSARVVATASRAEELPVARLARHAADRVLLPLTGRALAPGRTDLLLDSHVAAHVVGRLAPLFFGDQHDALLLARTREGRDAFASPAISLVDDAAAPGGPIRTVRDAEGTPKRRTVLVEAGRVVGRLTDVESAARLGSAFTGNAVRLTWSDPPRIGVTNFYVDPSPGVSPLDLLASVSKGLYAAVLLERPEVDLAADRFRLVVAGYTVEKGRAAERISECGISGRLSELLRGVAALGDDLKFVAGAGGGVGSPTLYVPRWKIS
jgi:PmbA protein